MSGGLVVLVPLRVEALAVRAGLGREGRVVLVGMGPERASRSAVSAAAVTADARAVVVAGVAGGVAPHLRAGDVVVATSLARPEGQPRDCPAGASLATHLRARGLPVTEGPIVGVERIAGPAERARLAVTAVAVDMESAWLQPEDERVFAVARVVVDTGPRRLADPRTLVAGVRALLSLVRVGRALRDWKPPARGTILAP